MAVAIVVVVVSVGVGGLILLYQLNKAANDQLLANALDQRLKAFLAKRSALLPTAATEIREYKGLRLGEVSRHFDASTNATITGWLTHDLGFHGWGIGGSVGALGLGVGKLGLSGTSEVNLTFQGTTRDDMMGDGFIAVFEQDTQAGVDTLRVVVPSEQATRELAAAILEELLNRTIAWPQSHATLRGRIPELLAYRNEASYVSDRLHAVLRMPPESRPLIQVYGEPVSGHAVLGGVIQVVGDDTIFPLFPLSLFREVPQMIEQVLFRPNERIDTWRRRQTL